MKSYGFFVIIFCFIILHGKSAATDDDNVVRTMSWLNPAEENARQISSDASSFASQLRRIANQAKEDLLDVPQCPDQSVKSKIHDFTVSIDEAKSSGDGLERSCRELGNEWLEFHDFFDAESKRKTDLTPKDIEVILHKLNALQTLCSKCGEEYPTAEKKLTVAIGNSRILIEAFAVESRKAQKAESDVKMKGAVLTGVTGTVAAGLLIASGGTAAPVLATTKAAVGGGWAATKAALGGGLGVFAAGSACYTWMESSRLQELSDEFSAALGKMSDTLIELHSLFNLILKLERQTKDMAENIRTGHGMHSRYQKTLQANEEEIRRKDEENRKLQQILKDHAISY